MEAGIHYADFLLVVSTAKYKVKSDGRTGGVGLETFLTTSLHSDGLLRDKRRKIIVLQRERDSTLRYLNGHFHLDFKDDAEYLGQIEKLLARLHGNSCTAQKATELSSRSRARV
jgi:hypothetical protein